MKHFIFSLVLFFYLSLSVCAQNKYEFSVDLTQCADDKLTVDLITPSFKNSEIIYRMPKIVPGTYEIFDFGRFVSNFIATDSSGKILSVDHFDLNSWKISSAAKLYKISYKVEDTWDTELGSPVIFEPAGSNFEADKNFVLNTHCMFGYFEGFTNMPYQINITHPKEFYGSCSLEDVSFNGNVDTYKVPDYMDLQDAPMMYNVPDTTVLNVGGAKVLISIYSPNKVTTSKFISEKISEILMEQEAYLGGSLPIKKYVYLIYLTPTSGISGASGALEHSYSSMYFLPEMDQKYLAQTIRDVSAHEFFHIVTPLSIHAEQIGNFNYSDPKISEHLWLYEGTTEYAAGLVQIKYGEMSVDDYLKVIQKKIVAKASYNDTLPFTTMSAGCLKTYKDQYGNVYQKGALIGMCLDIKLRSLSEGKYGLQDLMKDLSKTYGKNQSFKDEELFGQIVKLTYPEIGDFLNAYVSGMEPLPLKEILALVGIDYGGGSNKKEITFGGISIGLNPATNKLMVVNTGTMDDFGKTLGYQEYDELVKFNGKEISQESAQQVIVGYLTTAKEGDVLKVIVKRKKTETSRAKKIKLKATVVAVSPVKKVKLALMEDPTTEQLKIRSSWIGKH